MVYAYVRVSTDRQTIENQRFEISRFCEMNNLKIGRWIAECTSGKKFVQERKLGPLIKRMKKNDILICSELSRLGRNLLMIMAILNECMEREIKVWTIKDQMRLGNDLNSVGFLSLYLKQYIKSFFLCQILFYFSHLYYAMVG